MARQRLCKRTYPKSLVPGKILRPIDNECEPGFRICGSKCDSESHHCIPENIDCPVSSMKIVLSSEIDETEDSDWNYKQFDDEYSIGLNSEICEEHLVSGIIYE